MSENKNFWKEVMVGIKGQVSEANFITWFKDTNVVKRDSGVVYIGVPSEFFKDWLYKKFHSMILKTMRGIDIQVRSIEYVVSEHKPEGIEKVSKQDEAPSFDTLPLNDLYIDKEDGLNPRYVFDSFVVGPFNELAYAASQAVVGAPGTIYNPLFIYGKTGHGKTHIIQAVGNQIKKTNPDKKVFYITSEMFALDYLNALQKNKMGIFKEKYRKYDILIMDDIQFFSNKEKTQEELFHVFNALYENNKQVVFSSDRHPNYLPGLEERLKSRFGQGMIVDIPRPDHESRVAILQQKAKLSNFDIKEDILEYLATNIDGNIRELEGVLNSVACQTSVKQKDLSLNEVKNLVKNSIRPKKIVPVEDVIKIISGFYGIDEENIYKKTRKKEVVKPRQVIMYILREDFNIPYPTIGQKLGGRDHTTCIHSYEKIKSLLEKDSALESEIHQIRGMI
jgi:chromosomal replication initiator protein